MRRERRAEERGGVVRRERRGEERGVVEPKTRRGERRKLGELAARLFRLPVRRAGGFRLG